MIGIGAVFALLGLFFAGCAALSAVRRRIGNALFWGLAAMSFLLGDRLGDLGNGVLALGLAAIAGSGGLRAAAADDAPAPPPAGNRLFVPALAIPAVTVAGAVALPHLPALVAPGQATLVALAAAVAVAFGLALLLLRPHPAEPVAAGLRLADQVGWAALLPQMLAALGAVFAVAHVGDALGQVVGRAIPVGSLAAAVLAYTLGTAALTAILGNAFAAFPVTVAAIGVPLLVRAHGGDPAPIAAIGMLSGFCGTLLTPMAANFNLVPAALLDLPDRYGVIRAQAPTALLLLAANTMLLYWLAFP